MSRALSFCIWMLSVTIVCFAQSNQTENLSFTTYYPAPYGVYQALRLTPSGEPDPSKIELNQAGTMYFNDSDYKPYIHNGTSWGKIGAGSNFYSETGISPDQCSGVISTEAYNNGQLCSGPWYKDVTFSVPFTKTPHVMVLLESAPNNTYSPCAYNVTDRYIGYPDNITVSGFRLWASGSPPGLGNDRSTCSPSSDETLYNDWFTRVTANWFAISE
jgi:hypothetical protein